MNLGAEPKKVAQLAAVLVFGAGIVYWANSDSSDSPPAPAPRPVATSVAAPAARPSAARPKAKTDRRQIGNRGSATAWNIRQGPQNPEDRQDPATVDPTLKTDLLAKVQSVELGAPGRNLFVFGAPPPPPMPQDLPKVQQIITRNNAPPPPVGPPPPPQAITPQAPPITLKYYGFKISRTDGHKAAFLLDGEDILIGGENDVIKKHYRIVRISVSTITIEDTDFKTSQTLQIQENTAG